MELDLDEDGYLSRLEDWCKLAAIALGKTADIELTSQHWIVICLLYTSDAADE